MMKLHQLEGQTIGQYKLLELLGAGAMGAVYRAYQQNLDRDVALKVLTYADDEPALQRFYREARIAASLEHPHIVPVYDYGTARDISYVTMRYLKGKSLEERIKQARGPVPIRGVLRLATQLASALDYAQERSVVHRDIKPRNVVLDVRGNAYLVDFGLARSTADDMKLTASGMIVGTPTYMAPEQWQNKITPAVDQYALAVMVYELLAGQPPFSADNPVDFLMHHLNDPVPPIQRADLPQAIMPVLLRALAKEPDARYPRSGEFAKALVDAVRRRDVKTTVSAPKAVTIEPNDPPPTRVVKASASRPQPASIPAAPVMERPVVINQTSVTVNQRRNWRTTNVVVMAFVLVWAIMRRVVGAVAWVAFFIIKIAMRSIISIILTILIMSLMGGVAVWFAVSMVNNDLDMGIATSLMTEQLQALLSSIGG